MKRFFQRLVRFFSRKRNAQIKTWQRSICLLFWTPAWEAPGQNFYSGSKCFYSDTDAAAAGAAVEAAAGATAATAACILSST